MRRTSLWFIVGIMLLAFSGLLYMQVSYITLVFEARNDQFNDVIRQILYNVNKDLERDEVRELIVRELGMSKGYADELLKSSPNEKKQSESFNLDQLPFIEGNKDIISERLDAFRDNHEARYQSIRSLVLDLAMKMVREQNPKPIYERMSSDQLMEYIDYYLTRYDIQLPYIYEVVNRNQQVFFSNGRVPIDSASSVYTQAIFTNDNPSQLHYLRVYFPGKRAYISSTIGFLVPSIIFTILLLISFTYSIITLFRQKKLDEMRTDFINNMTHELKTPVSTILLGTSMLGDDDVAFDEARREKALNSIMAEGNRLNLLIEKVLQMSFFDDHSKMKLKREELDMEELIINVTSIFSLKVEGFGGDVELELSADHTKVMGDQMHLTNIIFNLLDNAVKYRKEHVPPMIKVTTRNAKDKLGNPTLMIIIKDNGIGIRKEYLRKIFDRFYRVPTGNRHDVKGFGLGLAYVSRMVLVHKGTITAESEIGKGTSFVIALPIAK